MLIKFDSKVGALTMFGDVAQQLLKLMGHSGTVPSAILAADIPAAVERLERALAAGVQAPAAKDEGADEEMAPVSLRQRAFPFLDLLKRAAARQADVMWDAVR
jgi:hypothetical protein